MSFEAIPEDKCESYPCPICGKGSVIITLRKSNGNITWECDTCEFVAEQRVAEHES